MATKSTAGDAISININPIDTRTAEYFILGKSPLICNRMSQKVWWELLAPKGRKTESEKQSSLKHDPVAEFRASPYTISDVMAPTFIGMMPSAFKRAMGTAALDCPGAKKTQIGRLVHIEGEMVPIFGVPKLFMAITRSADMAKTPDVRTRAILPEWACRVKVTYTQPMLRETSVTNLLNAAGVQCGIGDWRQEKGSGSYGSFKLVEPDDPDFVRITTTMGRDVQTDALNSPEAYNEETAEMMEWFNVEIVRRGFRVAA